MRGQLRKQRERKRERERENENKLISLSLDQNQREGNNILIEKEYLGEKENKVRERDTPVETIAATVSWTKK